MVWHSPTYSNDDILPTTIHQEPTGPPSFLAVNLEAKSFTLVGILEFTSGSPIVGDSKTIHVSKSRPFWNKCLFRSMVWHSPTYSNDDILPTTIHQEPTPLPFFAHSLLFKRFQIYSR